MTDAELLAEIEAAMAAPSGGESLGRGLAQGATLGWGDELAGAARATKLLKVPKDVRTPGPRQLAKLYPGMPYPEASSRWFNENRPDQQAAQAAESARVEQQAGYRGLRNEVRAKNEAASAAHPKLYLGGQVAGALPAMLATGGGVGTVAGLGAFQGAGYSDSDTGSGLAGDAALGAAGGLAGYGVGKLLGAGVQAAGRLAGRKLTTAAQRAAAAATEDATADVASKVGKYGGLRQTENKAILNLLAREQSGLLDAANQAELATLRQSGRLVQALNESAANDLEFLATRIPAVAAAKGEATAAQAALPQTIATDTAKKLSGKEAREQVMARLNRYGPVALGSAAGTVMGGPLGTAVGALAGAGTRPMVRALFRMANNPAVQTSLLTPVRRATDAASTPGMSLLRNAAARGAMAGAMPPAESLMSPVDAEAEAEAELQRLLSGGK